MKVIHVIRRLLVNLYLPLIFLNSISFAMEVEQELECAFLAMEAAQECVQSLESVSQNDFDCTVEVSYGYGKDMQSDTPIVCEESNNITSVRVALSDAVQDVQYTRVFEGQEYVQFAETCRQIYSEKSLQDAISCYVADAMRNASQGNVNDLVELIYDPTQQEKLMVPEEICSEPVSQGKQEEVEEFQAPKDANEIKQRVNELLDDLKDQDSSAEFVAAQKEFEQKAIMRNTRMLSAYLVELETIRGLRHDPSLRARLVQGVNKFAQQAAKFMNVPNAKNLCDFLATSIYDGKPHNDAERYIEEKFSTTKRAIINEHLSIGDHVVFHNPSKNTSEVLAFCLCQQIQKCAPEVLGTVLSEWGYVPGFKAVSDYAAMKEQSWFQRAINQIISVPHNMIYGITKTSINSDRGLISNQHFQRLVIINSLCRSGRIEQAQLLVKIDSPAEQELIQEYQRQLPPRTQGGLVLEGQHEIRKANPSVLFPVNNHAADIIQAYGKDIKEIADFKPESWKQFATHAYIVESINKQAERVFTSQNVTEQAFAMYAIDGLIKAHDLNKSNQLEHIGEFLSMVGKEAGDVTTHFVTTFLSRLAHNASHPIEYIQERVQAVAQLCVGGAKLSYFIVDASLGQLFRTPEQREVYFNELKVAVKEACNQLSNLSAKDVAGIVADVMGDMVFDGGLNYAARLGSRLLKLSVVVDKASQCSKLVQKVKHASKFLTFSNKAIEKAVTFVTKNSNRVDHIFAKLEHKLEPLVKKLGGKENVVRAVLKAANGKIPKTANGVFENIPVNVSGFTVYIRGRVCDGIPKLGTFFIK